MARWLAGLLFAIAVATLAYAVVSVRDAYDWVAHTSDVRVAIAGAVGVVLDASTDREACAATRSHVDTFARLTADNGVQQAHVVPMRAFAEATCAGDAAAAARLTSELRDADHEEVRLLYLRRAQLEHVATSALAVFTCALVGAFAFVFVARRERARSARALAESEERFRHLAESATDLIRVHAPDGRYLYVTPSCELLLGFTQEEVLAMSPIVGLAHEDEVDAIKAFIAALRTSGGVTQVPAITHRIRCKSGAYRWFETQGRPVFDGSGTVVRFYTTSRDVSERLEAEQKLAELSITDELTQLHNRRGFQVLAKQQRSLAVRQKRPLVLLYADLDGLKRINDEQGHARGDEAIRDFADVMRPAFRSCDVIARIGGDEFVALAFDTTDGAMLEQRLHAALRTFNARAERPYELAASIGSVTLPPDSEKSIDEVLAEADETMYASKRAKAAARETTSRHA